MNHSITARYTARSEARFVRRPARAHDARLGLRRESTFRAAQARPTLLRDVAASPVAGLRGGREMLRIIGPRRSTGGVPRPAVVMHWSSAGPMGVARRTSPAVSPWLG